DVKGLVIGIEEDFFFNRVDATVEKLVRNTIQQLADLGAKVEPVKIPALKYAEYAELVTSLSEASTIHHRHLIARPDDFGHDIRMLFELGELFTAVEYLQAQQLRRQLKQDFEKAFAQIDVLIAPTLPIVMPDIGDNLVDLNGE